MRFHILATRGKGGKKDFNPFCLLIPDQKSEFFFSKKHPTSFFFKHLHSQEVCYWPFDNWETLVPWESKCFQLLRSHLI